MANIILLLLIFIFGAPWSSSSPARHHDLHHLDLYQCVITWSSRQLLLLQLLLSHSDKVKQLHGDCIAYNKATTIWLLPVADNSVTKHDHLIQYNLASCLDHITSQHALQKQVRRPLIVVACFTWLLWVSSKNVFLPTWKPQHDLSTSIYPS